MTTHIDISLSLAADTPRVFRALTDSHDLMKWWTTAAVSQPEEGGVFAYQWTFPKAPERDHIQHGTYTEFTKNAAIAYPWAVHGLAQPTTVRFTLESSGNQTRLHLTHTGWKGASPEAYTAHEMGWQMFLQNLKHWLETGNDNRAAVGIRTLSD